MVVRNGDDLLTGLGYLALSLKLQDGLAKGFILLHELHSRTHDAAPEPSLSRPTFFTASVVSVIRNDPRV